MTDTISGEEHKRIASSKTSSTKSPNKNIYVIIAVFVIACVVSFYLGVNYQKGHSKTVVTAATAGRFGGRGGFGGSFGNHVFGTVSSISANSITINSRGGTAVTLAINSSTQITNGGQTGTVSDIQTGDTVIASKSSTNSSDASSIIVNPSFGGGGASSNSSGSSTSGSSTTSTGGSSTTNSGSATENPNTNSN